MITLEEKVKEFINTNGIKKKFFANLLGISVAKLSAMLQGKRKNGRVFKYFIAASVKIMQTKSRVKYA